jgi:hypothetical protein
MTDTTPIKNRSGLPPGRCFHSSIWRISYAIDLNVVDTLEEMAARVASKARRGDREASVALTFPCQ